MALSKNICRRSAGFKALQLLLPQPTLKGWGGLVSRASAGDAPATLAGGAGAGSRAQRKTRQLSKARG